jgi:hypothetical protein
MPKFLSEIGYGIETLNKLPKPLIPHKAFDINWHVPA